VAIENNNIEWSVKKNFDENLSDIAIQTVSDFLNFFDGH